MRLWVKKGICESGCYDQVSGTAPRMSWTGAAICWNLQTEGVVSLEFNKKRLAKHSRENSDSYCKLKVEIRKVALIIALVSQSQGLLCLVELTLKNRSKNQ